MNMESNNHGWNNSRMENSNKVKADTSFSAPGESSIIHTSTSMKLSSPYLGESSSREPIKLGIAVSSASSLRAQENSWLVDFNYLKDININNSYMINLILWRCSSGHLHGILLPAMEGDTSPFTFSRLLSNSSLMRKGWHGSMIQEEDYTCANRSRLATFHGGHASVLGVAAS